MENQPSNNNMASHPCSLLKLEDYYFAGRSGPDEYFECMGAQDEQVLQFLWLSRF